MRSCSLHFMIALTGMVFGAEIVSSHVTQSLVLLLSAYHMLYNMLSLLLLVISRRMSCGKTLTNTFGWARIKVLGLLVNILFLSALCFAVIVEAVQTMVHASHENTEPRYPKLLITLGIVDFVVNILCFLLIGGYTHHQGCSMTIQGNDVQMNCVLIDDTSGPTSCIESEEAARKPKKPNTKPGFRCWDHHLLDFARDVCSCLPVIVCGCVILFMNGLLLKYADAILAIASVIILTSTTYPFVKESGLILLQSVPDHIDVDALTKRLLHEFPDVLDVHDVHVWRMTIEDVIATLHIMLLSPSIYTRIEESLTLFFAKEGISSVTMQPEFTNGNSTENSNLECILKCSSNNNCDAFTCCGPLTERSESTPRQRITSSQQNGISQEECEVFVISETSESQSSKCDFAGMSSVTETAV